MLCSEIKAYFENSYDLNESIFAGLKGSLLTLLLNKMDYCVSVRVVLKSVDCVQMRERFTSVQTGCGYLSYSTMGIRLLYT